jgi:hypothetical protein
VELARFTAATSAFSLHATGMVMACATGANAIKPPGDGSDPDHGLDNSADASHDAFIS